MSGQNNKTQSTKKTPVSSSQTEIEELKRQNSELQSENKELSQQNALLQFKIDKLEQENKQLRFNNDELSKQNKTLYDNYEFLQLINEDDTLNDEDSIRPAKRQMRKKPSEEEEKAKVLMKTLLKTFPELELRGDETFKSKTNVEICQKLIPKLRKEMKPHNPTYEQVEVWLQSIHKSKRYAYLKSNQLNQPNPIPLYSEFNYLQEAESDDAIRSAKRQTKLKERKSNNFSEDEDELKIEEGAKSQMKALLKTYPNEYTLKIDDTFKSQANTDICDRLIPKLQREVTPYNLSYEQVESWLQTFHKSKRNAYLKQLNQSSLDNNELDDLQEDESDGSIQLTKQQTKSKKSNISEDEDGLKAEERAKLLMRTLLKTIPSELNLRDEETFKSKTNVEICQKLIPRLKKEMKAFNPTYEQLETWLQSIHRSKRNAYLKSNQLNQPNPISLDDELDYLQEAESDDVTRSAKRQTKSKERKPSNDSEDENELKNEEESKIEEGAKNLMKRLLDKTYTQDEYKLKFECTFKSQVNTDICEKLIPMLQKDIKPTYNLSQKQVESWLQNFHKSRRRTFKKSNQMDID